MLKKIKKIIVGIAFGIAAFGFVGCQTIIIDDFYFRNNLPKQPKEYKNECIELYPEGYARDLCFIFYFPGNTPTPQIPTANQNKQQNNENQKQEKK